MQKAPDPSRSTPWPKNRRFSNIQSHHKHLIIVITHVITLHDQKFRWATFEQCLASEVVKLTPWSCWGIRFCHILSIVFESWRRPPLIRASWMQVRSWKSVKTWSKLYARDRCLDQLKCLVSSDVDPKFLLLPTSSLSWFSWSVPVVAKTSQDKGNSKHVHFSPSVAPCWFDETLVAETQRFRRLPKA